MVLLIDRLRIVKKNHIVTDIKIFANPVRCHVNAFKNKTPIFGFKNYTL